MTMDLSGEEMTSTFRSNLDMLRQTLEEQYEVHTEQLTALAVGRGDAESASSDEYTRTALITSSRRALSEIAHALRRMTQGTYGFCEHCEIAIPAERLEVLPHTRFCATCQTARR
jgi:DnaK suppressor protein